MTWETECIFFFKTPSEMSLMPLSVCLTHYLSPVELLIGQARALKQHFLLARPPRCLIGPPWAESPVTHTAAAAMAGNCPPLPVCGQHWGSVCTSSSGTVWLACERARTLRLSVSSLEPSPAAWTSQRCCCPLAVGGGAAPQGEEPESSPEPRKVSALTREH